VNEVALRPTAAQSQLKFYLNLASEFSDQPANDPPHVVKEFSKMGLDDPESETFSRCEHLLTRAIRKAEHH